MIYLTAQETERKKRLIAFVIITLVFIASVALLLNWAINTAAARFSSRTIASVAASAYSSVVIENAIFRSP